MTQGNPFSKQDNIDLLLELASTYLVIARGCRHIGNDQEWQGPVIETIQYLGLALAEAGEDAAPK